MLATNERTLLLESLRPPEGYDLDFAITTTFTLDLVSLLTAPIGFTYFELEGDPDVDKSALDPLVLLQTVRRYSGRITVFCQSGHIKVPKIQQPLFASLEKTVIPVNASHSGGIFHPKVWILRFIADEEPVRYRVITQSRNLTFDKCWDTSVVLDGTLTDRQVGYGPNRPLSDFVAALPGLAPDGVSSEINANIEVATRELRKVLFDLPTPFEDYSFHPFGIENYSGSVRKGKGKALIISPFLTAGIVDELSQLGSHTTLVSRLDQLEAIAAEDLQYFDEIFTVDPALEAVSDLGASDFPTAPSSGLHAKVYVTEEGGLARVWTGSANCTDAAFNRNVEFMVSLIGPKNQCGVKSVLGEDADQGAFRKLLLPYAPRAEPVVCDEVEENLEKLLDEARGEIASATWTAAVSQQQDSFAMGLSSTTTETAITGVSCKVWPITLTDVAARDLTFGATVAFGPLTFEALTPFFAFELEATLGGKSQAIRFVVRTTLVGAPEDRDERLLNYYLRDPEQVLRFLLLLLTPNNPDSFAMADAAAETLGSRWAQGAAGGDSLLEAMLRAVCSNSTALDSVASTIDELRRTPEGTSLLPRGFDDVWAAIWAARQQIARTAR